MRSKISSRISKRIPHAVLCLLLTLAPITVCAAPDAADAGRALVPATPT